MTVEHEKTVVANHGLKPPETEQKDTVKSVWELAATETVKFTTGGKLRVSVGWQGSGSEAQITYDSPDASEAQTCTATASGT